MRPPLTTSVKQSISSLMGGIVDYAGMFPPARLSLDDALSNYRQYTDGQFAWMLNRFVCPFSALTRLQQLLRQDPPSATVRLSLIAPVQLDDTPGVSKLLFEINELNEADNHIEIDAVEIRAGDPGSADFQTSLQLVANDGGKAGLVDVYVEVPWDEETGLESAAASVAGANGNGVNIGLKIRSGGIEPHMVPPADRLAQFIQVCANADVMFKATAGLHHPYPNYDEAVGATMHGFVNVFFASAAAVNGLVDEERMVELLSDSDSRNFVFKSSSMSWKDIELSADEMSSSRRTFGTTFGSCSFDEPIQDLQQLELLPLVNV